MSDLVERLRTVGIGRNFKIFAVCEQAAARIEALDDRINELEQAKQDAGEAMEIYVERIEALENENRELRKRLAAR